MYLPIYLFKKQIIPYVCFSCKPHYLYIYMKEYLIINNLHVFITFVVRIRTSMFFIFFIRAIGFYMLSNFVMWISAQKKPLQGLQWWLRD